mmetsp:Transcript_2006/g.5658  ORF Transcript_2006/g.5658 Transcript_2006/m.5658 type:complete len:275 (-) Transcript_2006:56-880(-)
MASRPRQSRRKTRTKGVGCRAPAWHGGRAPPPRAALRLRHRSDHHRPMPRTSAQRPERCSRRPSAAAFQSRARSRRRTLLRMRRRLNARPHRRTSARPQRRAAPRSRRRDRRGRRATLRPKSPPPASGPTDGATPSAGCRSPTSRARRRGRLPPPPTDRPQHGPSPRSCPAPSRAGCSQPQCPRASRRSASLASPSMVSLPRPPLPTRSGSGAPALHAGNCCRARRAEAAPARGGSTRSQAPAAGKSQPALCPCTASSRVCGRQRWGAEPLEML